MGYKLHGACYETLLDMHIVYAQECSKVGGQGTGAVFYYCTASETDVVIQGVVLSTGATYTPYSHTPQQIACTYEAPVTYTLSDMVELSWLIIGVWVVAWCARKVVDSLKPHTP